MQDWPNTGERLRAWTYTPHCEQTRVRFPLLVRHCAQQQRKASPGYCTSIIPCHSPDSPLLRAHMLLLRSASALWIASKFVQQPAQAQAQVPPCRAALHRLSKPTVCETLRYQLYHALSSDDTQRPWLQTNPCSERLPSSQTCARVLLNPAKGPLHLHGFGSSVLRGPEPP